MRSIRQKAKGLVIAIFLPAIGLCANRLYLDAAIDGKPSQLVLDTGTSGSTIVLFSDAARRLGLKDIRKSGDLVGKTGEYSLSMLGASFRTSFLIYDKPGYLPGEGAGTLPYWSVAQNVWTIDLPDKLFNASKDIPVGLRGFIRAKIIHDETKILGIEIPNGSSPALPIAIDTGQDSGITLSHAQWKKWSKANPDIPLTLDASFMPGAGVVARPEKWASTFTIGDLVIHGVPVKEANDAETASEGAGTVCLLG
ncbi:MAG TPA: hypothetical protein VFE25_15930, partial [Opitutaceae bacterium]|nr:hypothetical protein [Opitutaceae bacterium]